MPLRSSLIPQLLRPSSLFHHAHAIRTSRPSPSLWGPSGNIITFPRPTRPSPVTRLAQGTRTFPRNPVFRRAQSTRAKGPDPDPEPASLSQRLRKLSREYGWAALGVYLALSALDFPFCFAAVRLFGVDRIGHYEGVIVDTLKGMLPGRAEPDSDSAGAAEGASESQIAQAHRRNRGEEASIWTQLALAYAIHKSFIFIRVPLTAAVTPKVVKVLRRWGWSIGKRKPKGT